MSGQYFRSAYLEEPKVVRPRFLADGGSSAVTMPNPGADAQFVLTAGSQTVAGEKTFSAGLSVSPTAASGGGVKFAEMDSSGAVGHADALPVKVVMLSTANTDSARPNTVFRIGYNMTDAGAFRADETEAAASLSFEQYYEQTEGVFWQEQILQVYDSQGQTFRPFAVYSDRDDITTQAGVVFGGTGLSFSPIGMTNAQFGMNTLTDLYGMTMPTTNIGFRFVGGDKALGADPTLGRMEIIPYGGSGANGTKTKIAHTGGSGEILFIGGAAGGGEPDRNPRLILLSPESGGGGALHIRRQVGGVNNVSFGFGVDPGTSGVTDKSVHFADGGNMVFQTTTGTQIGTSATQKIGIWGATPIVRPTISTADAASIITALANIGLVVDGTA